MGDSTDAYDFRALLAQLDETIDWLNGLGLSQYDRIRRNRSLIERMLQASDAETVSQLQDSLSDEDAREIFWSYVDADEFIRATTALRPYDSLDLTACLERALSGPVDLLTEDRSSNTGRNAMFELVVAGRIADGGYKPSLDGCADVSFQFAQSPFAIECKRPLTETGLEAAIGKANRQLGRCSDATRIVAISVSRLLNEGDPFGVPVVRSESDILPYLETEVRTLIAHTRRYWETGRDNLDGLHFYAFVPVKTSGGRYYPARYDVIVPVRSYGLKRDMLSWLQQALNLSSFRESM